MELCLLSVIIQCQGLTIVKNFTCKFSFSDVQNEYWWEILQEMTEDLKLLYCSITVLIIVFYIIIYLYI